MARKKGGKLNEKKVKAIVRKELREEKEVNEFHYAWATEITNQAGSPIIRDMTADIIRGTDGDEFVGNQLKYKAIQFRYSLQPKSTGVGDMVRLMIIQWKSDSGTDTPTFSEILADNSTSPTTSFLTIDDAYKSKFNVLWDRLEVIPAYGNINTSRCLGKKVITGKYLAKVDMSVGVTTGTNHIYLLVFGTKGTGNSATNMYASFKSHWTE